MIAMLRLSRRCHERLVGWGTMLAIVVVLAGCGAQERSAREVPQSAGRSVPESSARAVPESSARAVPESSARSVPESSARAPVEGSTRPMPAEVEVFGSGARPVATTDSSPALAPPVRKVAQSPFELVGTGISAVNTFAVLKEADQRMLTVHEGDRIDGYTIAAIAPDRVKVRLPDNSEQLLMLLAATGSGASPTPRASSLAPDPTSNTAPIAEAINTDQSIPEDVTFGPTGSLPEGVKQMGH